MKSATLAGLVLLALGVVSLAYQGITYTTHRNVFAVGSLQATREEKRTAPLPPVLGCLALMGGVVLLATGTRKDSLAG